MTVAKAPTVAVVYDDDAVRDALSNLLSSLGLSVATAGVTPGLGTLIVGDDAASANYVNMKHRDSEQLGIASLDVRLPATAGVCTMGSPRVGDREFAAAFDVRFGARAARYVNDADIVTHAKVREHSRDLE